MQGEEAGGGGGGGGDGGGGGGGGQQGSGPASAASSYLSGISSWFKSGSSSSSSAPSSPYSTLAANPQPPPPITQQRQSLSSPSQPSTSSPLPPPLRPSGGYVPPTLAAQQQEEAQRASDSVAASMPTLLSSASSATSSPSSSAASSHPGSGANSPSSHYSPSHMNPSSFPPPPPTSQFPPPPSSSSPHSHPSPSSSSSPPEFSRSTIPININALWVGSDLLLTYAAKQDQTSIIHLLYQAGADIEAADPNGWSALTHAAAAGSVRAVRALLDIGADPLAKTKSGLTPSQCTASAEIRRELEVEEGERRGNVESQVMAVSATRSMPLLSSGGLAPPSLPPSFSSATSSHSFHIALYEVLVPIEVRSGARFDVQYRCPPAHSEKDCLSLYYVDSEAKPYLMTPRMGVNFYIPTQHVGGERYRRMTITADSRSAPPGLYRLVYYDATTATFPAASNLFHVIAQPSSNAAAAGSASLASWFDPTAWSNPSNPSSHIDISNPVSSSTPIILHPDFQLLSSPSPANLDSFLLPIPPYFLFSFTLNPVAVRLALELDPELVWCRDQLVPHRMKEKEFWQSYFYKMVALDWRGGLGAGEEEGEGGGGRGRRGGPAQVEARVQDGPIENMEGSTPRGQAEPSVMLGYQAPQQGQQQQQQQQPLSTQPTAQPLTQPQPPQQANIVGI